MRRYYQHWKRIFLAPDNGAPSGGSPGNPGANQGGAQQGQGSDPNANTDPFAKLDLDDLTPEARTIIEQGKAEVARLQKEAADAKAAAEAEGKKSREYQSRHDQLQNQVQKLTGQAPGQLSAAEAAKAAQLEKFSGILIKRGVPAENAKAQAELMLEMMGEYGATLKQEIGRDLSPLATTVISREAEYAWQLAAQSDRVGALQIPEVAQKAWDQVQLSVQQGQPLTPETVSHLVGMAYYEHIQQHGVPQQQQQQTNQPPVFQQQNPPPALPNIGRMSYPGNNAQRPAMIDPNAPRHTLDAATDAALQVVFKKWEQGQGGVKAPGLRSPQKGGR